MKEYTDIKNNTRKITHTTLYSAEEKQELENKIVEELYKIFTKK